jgi:hypothetical protein
MQLAVNVTNIVWVLHELSDERYQLNTQHGRLLSILSRGYVGPNSGEYVCHTSIVICNH